MKTESERRNQRMQDRDIHDLRKFMGWCFAFSSLLRLLFFHRRILFMICQHYAFLPLRSLLDCEFSLLAAAILGVAWWAVWKGKPSARSWGIAASLAYILTFLDSFAFPRRSIWGHNWGSLVVGTIGMVLFLRKDHQHDTSKNPSDPADSTGVPGP